MGQFLAQLPGTDVIALALNGQDALRIAQLQRPDLVLLDIAMPGMGGLDVARTMQTWPQPPTTVFLSMNDGLAYQAAARELGVMAVVGKGDFVADLLPIIEQLILNQAHPDAIC